jgi:hypothetical protein
VEEEEGKIGVRSAVTAAWPEKADALFFGDDISSVHYSIGELSCLVYVFVSVAV